MLSQVLETVFLVAGLLVCLLLCFRMRRLSGKDRNAAAAAAFGLFLCARYSSVAQGEINEIFAIGVGFLMALLAFNSLGFIREAI